MFHPKLLWEVRLLPVRERIADGQQGRECLGHLGFVVAKDLKTTMRAGAIEDHKRHNQNLLLETTNEQVELCILTVNNNN